MGTEARRSFIGRLGAGVAAFGAALAGGSRAQAQPAAQGPWQPVRHALDDWFDQVPGKHRCFFDTATSDALSDAINFAGNYFTANKSGYGLDAADLALVIGVRHQSAPFAFTDAIWAKYGATLAARAKYTDPNSSDTPTKNPFAPVAAASGARASGLTGLIERGVRISVCDLSAHGIAGLIAQKTGGKAEAIYAEITANMIGNARLVPAGIVAVNRAQERGYSMM